MPTSLQRRRSRDARPNPVFGRGHGAQRARGGATNDCCTPSSASSPGPAEVLLDCAAASDSATVYIRVKGNTATACIPYEVEYHF